MASFPACRAFRRADPGNAEWADWDVALYRADVKDEQLAHDLEQYIA